MSRLRKVTRGNELESWRRAIASSDLSATTKHVALALSLHMEASLYPDVEDPPFEFPSIETLARECSLSYDTVRRHLRKLRKAGWLTSMLDRQGVYGGTRVFYWIAFGTTSEEPELPVRQ